MAVTNINGVTINKITKSQYDSEVLAGNITAAQQQNEVFIFTDDQHVSASEKNAWNAKSDFSGSYEDLTNKPELFSGSYNDLTDKPTIPSVTGLASETYVNTKIADLVNSAPTTLDTLGEIATAIEENEDVVTALNSAIGNKVDKVTGKSLVSDTEIAKLATVEENANYYVLPSDVVQDSAYVHTDNNYSDDEQAKVTANTNARHTHSNKTILDATTASFTTTLETKLNNVETGAEVNIVEDVKVNGTSLSVTNKSVNIEVPTAITRVWSLLWLLHIKSILVLL